MDIFIMFLRKVGGVELHGREVGEQLVEAVLHHVVEGLDVVRGGQSQFEGLLIYHNYQYALFSQYNYNNHCCMNHSRM